MSTTLRERLKAANLTDQEIGAVEKMILGTEVSNIQYLATKEDIARVEGKVAKVEAKLNLLLWFVGGGFLALISLIGVLISKIH